MDPEEVERSNDAPYPVKEDTPFTPTETQEIERLKGELLEDLAKVKATKDMAEILALKTCIYAVSRMLLLCGGSIGVYFCFLTLFASFMRDNRDFFKSDDIHYSVGSMNKILKVLVSLLGCVIFAYSAVGDYLGLVKVSSDAYNSLASKIEKFHTPMSQGQEQLIAVGVGAGITFLVLAGSEIIRKKD